jgi:hypothetical protein
VGGHPDYLLTVWDWENATMILRCKAFSQEVFKVDFSRYFRGQLLTSGVGHLRFWKMASTFTGLKLEGAIAKFGTVPISDIAGYFELRNSKVRLILWNKDISPNLFGDDMFPLSPNGSLVVLSHLQTQDWHLMWTHRKAVWQERQMFGW